MKKLFVMLAAIAFVAAFTAPAFAAEWSFYGHARMTTFWADEDFGDYNPYTKTDGEDDDFDLSHGLQGNSRIGAKVKAGDNLVGGFEYGSGPNLRKLYGEYDFGGFKLLVGQTYVPVCIFISNQVFGSDNDLLGEGGVYNGRRPMIRAKFGDFQIALVEPTTPSAKDGGPLLGFADVETDVTIPMIQAKYSFKVAGLSLDLAGGYQTYDVVDAADDDENVSSYIGAIGATYSTGPFFLGADYWMGQNVGNMGMANSGFSFAAWDPVDEDFLDNDGYGFILVAAFTASDMLRFEAGYGYSKFDLDTADEEDDTSAMYIQAKITFAKGVFITPEIGKFSWGDDPLGDDEGSTTYYGLQWQVRF